MTQGLESLPHQVRIWHRLNTARAPDCCLPAASDANLQIRKCLPCHHCSLIACTTLSGRLMIKQGDQARPHGDAFVLHIIVLKAGVIELG